MCVGIVPIAWCQSVVWPLLSIGVVQWDFGLVKARAIASYFTIQNNVCMCNRSQAYDDNTILDKACGSPAPIEWKQLSNAVIKTIEQNCSKLWLCITNQINWISFWIRHTNWCLPLSKSFQSNCANWLAHIKSDNVCYAPCTPLR